MIKAAFFDVDGTLLSHKTKQVSQSTRAAIAELRGKGVKCIVATGRQISEMEKLPVSDMTFDGYLTLNGQMWLDGDKKVVDSTPIKGKVLDFLLEKFRDRSVPMMLVEKNRVYVNCVSDHVRLVQAAISSPIPPIGSYSGEDIYQVCIYLCREEEALLEPIAQDCVITRWAKGGVDVVAKGGGKVTGIRRYLQEQGVGRDEIIAFGDGENDMEMLSFAGIGVAMGNAEEKVKQAADYVTDDVDAEGIAKALRHFGMI